MYDGDYGLPFWSRLYTSAQLLVGCILLAGCRTDLHQNVLLNFLVEMEMFQPHHPFPIGLIESFNANQSIRFFTWIHRKLSVPVKKIEHTQEKLSIMFKNHVCNVTRTGRGGTGLRTGLL
jgi:hypothetical protein